MNWFGPSGDCGCCPPDTPACSLIDIASYGGNGTSHDVNYPASMSAGNILALAIAYVQEAPSGLAGWTFLRSTTLNGSGAIGTLATYYKVATGSEGATFNLTTSVTTKMVAIVTSLTCSPSNSASTNNGNSDTATPSAPSPSIGSDVFQMVCIAWIDGRKVSTFPSGYDGLFGGGGSGHGSSDLTLDVGWSDYARPTEAPGDIDIESTNPWATIVEVFG